MSLIFFFFNDTATTEIYTLSLHDALPICRAALLHFHQLNQAAQPLLDLSKLERRELGRVGDALLGALRLIDRKSTRLNSSHSQISYAVFCLKKKKRKIHLYIVYLNDKTST